MQRATTLALIALVAVISSACFGGATTHTGGGGQAGTVVPGVDWTIRYSIGMPAHKIANLPHRCPADSTCAPVRIGGGTYHWMLGVTRHVSCPSDAGDITPPSDCPAIARLRADLGRLHEAVCSCPAQLGLRGSATATVGGHRVRVPLDYCTYCPAGPEVTAALETLTRSR